MNKNPEKFAIEYLIRNGFKLEEDYNNFARQVIRIAIEALEKQMREKVIKKYYKDLDCGELYEEGYNFYCPECENEVGATSLTFKEVDWKTEYCCDCGKRLDWSDFE